MAFFFSWGLARAVVLAVGQVVVLGSNVSFFVCKSMKIKILNSIKTEVPFAYVKNLSDV